MTEVAAPGEPPWIAGAAGATLSRPEPANLADVLERVLDKGIVIAGDIRVNLVDVELLTIRIRLLVASVDRARELGIDWWEHDPALSSRARAELARTRPERSEGVREDREPMGGDQQDDHGGHSGLDNGGRDDDHGDRDG